MKLLEFLGDSLLALREFPEPVRKEAGVQLHKIQLGLEPSDWKPMPTIGGGVREVRIRDESGAYRLIYLATIGERVYVLHAFRKKTQKTPARDLDLARTRIRQVKQ